MQLLNMSWFVVLLSINFERSCSTQCEWRC